MDTTGGGRAGLMRGRVFTNWRGLRGLCGVPSSNRAVPWEFAKTQTVNWTRGVYQRPLARRLVVRENTGCFHELPPTGSLTAATRVARGHGDFILLSRQRKVAPLRRFSPAWIARRKVTLLVIAAVAIAGSVRLFPDWGETAEFDLFRPVDGACAWIELRDPRVAWVMLDVRVPRNVRLGDLDVVFRFGAPGNAGTADAQVLFPVGGTWDAYACGGDWVRRRSARVGDATTGKPLIDVFRGREGCTRIAVSVRGTGAEEFGTHGRVTLFLKRPRRAFWHWLLAECRVPGVAGRPPMAEALVIRLCGGS
ncbi:MAG: hypothetical protein BWZ02_00992 [Lentisphaerae bacterium ADurb.BinA184]|nr:MAG: hypothetical protein BWZ02_00992 [Lentisphaerae bacterium ADurb.BinA184]